MWLSTTVDRCVMPPTSGAALPSPAPMGEGLGMRAGSPRSGLRNSSWDLEGWAPDQTFCPPLNPSGEAVGVGVWQMRHRSSPHRRCDRTVWRNSRCLRLLMVIVIAFLIGVVLLIGQALYRAWAF